MKKRAIPVLFGLVLLLAGCAPGTLGPPPGEAGFRAGPYPTTALPTRITEDGVFLAAGPEGLALGTQLGPWQGLLFGSGSGARVRGSWNEDPWAVAADLAYLEYGYYDYQTNEAVFHQVLGLAVDAAYVWPLPTSLGQAYGGARARAYFGADNGDLDFGVLPGVTLGVRLPFAGTENRLSLGIEASFFLVSPLLTKESRWGAFSPFGLTLSYRF